MAVIHIEPQDLTPAQSAEIIRYLNQATSAAEIAARIEFPGELDIGVKLGERLLAARAALGGKFATVEQVAAVPLIGPERFSELCAGLLGIDPRSLGSVLDPQRNELIDRIARLEQALAALPAGTRGISLAVDVAPQPAWLGQALELTIQVRDGSGEALAGRRLTVETSHGVFESAFGFAIQKRQALDVVSNGDGSVRLRLHGPSIEPLSPAQEAALEDALSGLDATAASPDPLRDGFNAIIERYLSEREGTLRKAIDIYSRQYKAAFFEQLNASNLGYEWPMQSTVLRVDCHPDPAGPQNLAQAVVVVEWKNWVGAWFEFLRDFLDDRSKLGDTFRGVKGSGATSFRLVDSLLGEAHSFVATQSGLAAEWASQRVVQDALGEFLGDELDGVDDATQRELFANLEAAAGQLTAAHRGAIAMVTQARVDLEDRAQASDTRFASELAAAKVDTQKQFEDLSSNLGKIQLQISGIQDGSRSFQTQLDGMRNDLTSAKSDIGLIKTDIGLVKSDIGLVKTDVAGVKADVAGVKNDVIQVKGDVTRVRADVGTVRADVGAVQSDLGKVRLDLTALGPGRVR